MNTKEWSKNLGGHVIAFEDAGVGAGSPAIGVGEGVSVDDVKPFVGFGESVGFGEG